MSSKSNHLKKYWEDVRAGRRDPPKRTKSGSITRKLNIRLDGTIPLSRTMAAEIEGLRTWANGRARRASPLKNLAEAPKAGYRKFA